MRIRVYFLPESFHRACISAPITGVTVLLVSYVFDKLVSEIFRVKRILSSFKYFLKSQKHLRSNISSCRLLRHCISQFFTCTFDLSIIYHKSLGKILIVVIVQADVYHIAHALENWQ